jgi:formyltetrahydrofolate deformylase
MRSDSLIALLSGPDQPGLVARVSGWIYERGGNILHADQHTDTEANIFFQRIEWVPADSSQSTAEADAFSLFANENLGMKTRVAHSSHSARVALFVSKIDHCFHDTLLRFRAGEFAGELVCIVSNHPDLADEAAHFGIPFHHIAVTADNKETAEQQQLEVLRAAKLDLVVLARYMQVLSQEFLRALDCPVINIHHSFLPAFAGGRPYHQAYNRGVKLIGATAHYATADLDEGPIIHQDVTHISHRHSVSDLVRKGKDLEKSIFAQAIRWHLEHRILVYNNKTVVFD